MLQQVFSNRLKAVYIINAPPYAEKIFSLLKGVLKPKLIERVSSFWGFQNVSNNDNANFRYTFAKIHIF